jgi:hypothetical protein
LIDNIYEIIDDIIEKENINKNLRFLIIGDFGGGFEANELQKGLGLIAGLKKNFNFEGLVHGLLMTFPTFIWTGSWSVVRMPFLLFLPLLLTCLWVFINFLNGIKKLRLMNINWLIFWLFIFMYIGLLWHVIIMLALNGYGASGGHYFHILFPWIIPALSLGLLYIYKSKKQRIFVKPLIIFSALFQIIALWFHMTLFSGCASKGENKSFIFQGNLFCLDSSTEVLNNLSILNYSYFGLISFLLGFMMLGYLIVIELNKKLYAK